MASKNDHSDDFLTVAIRAAREAGEILKEGFLRGEKVEFQSKRDDSLVTSFDFQSEERIARVIKSQFHDHNIFGEESGGKVGDGYTWLIDPLDGTTNFVMGNPLFSVVISLLYKDEIILAVVFSPMLDRLYRAKEGDEGAYMNDNIISVSTTKDLEKSTLSVSMGERSRESIERFSNVASNFRRNARTIRVFGSVAFEICQVAAGNTDAHFYGNASLWDGPGPAFIAEKAGGKVSDLNGHLLVTNGKIHGATLRIVKESI